MVSRVDFVSPAAFHGDSAVAELKLTALHPGDVCRVFAAFHGDSAVAELKLVYDSLLDHWKMALSTVIVPWPN